MKILLLNPPISGQKKEELLMREPLGLAYLAGTLIANNFDVSVLDFFSYGGGKITAIGKKFIRGATEKEIVEVLKQFSPDIIGVTCNFTTYSKDALNLAEIAKKVHPNSIVVMGGAHASLSPWEQMMKNKFIDILVRGEGEITFLEIAKRFKAKKSFDKVRGTIVRKGKNIIVNPPRELIKNLDSLALPARELLDMEYYLRQSDIYGHTKKNRVATIITSRGCPYNCVFCCVKSLWGRKWRAFSAEKVVKEIKQLIERFGVNEIFIYDDNFIVDKKRIVNICKLIIKNKFKIAITIPQGLHINLIDFEILKALKEAGMYRIALPIETGCEKTANFIHKKFDKNDVNKKIEICHKLGLWTSGNFIIGFPYETKEDINKTIKFAEESKLDVVFYLIAQPFAGSDLFDIFKKERLLQNGNVDVTSTIMDSKYNTKHFTASELQSLRDKAAARYTKLKIGQYLSNPNLFLPKIKTIDGFFYLLKIITNKEFILRTLGKRKI